jgi:acetyl esterase/lipase
MWRGVVFDHGAEFKYEKLNPADVPPILFTVGDQDSILPEVRQMESWAAANKVSMQTILFTNTGHISWNAVQQKEALRKGVHFYLDLLK